MSLEQGAVALLSGLFSPGQARATRRFHALEAYVMLSRCRRAGDLWIAGLPRRLQDGRVPAFTPEPKAREAISMWQWAGAVLLRQDERHFNTFYASFRHVSRAEPGARGVN